MRQRGFTLVEVMLALGILFAGLVVLIKSTAENIATAQDAHALGVATELARGKMYDIEEILLDEGFQELDQKLDGDFDEEGWRGYTWDAVIEKIELPTMNALSAMDAAGEEGTEPGGGILSGGALGGIGSMLGMAGPGGAGGDAQSMATGGFIASQFELFSQVLEASIRKVTLTVHWKVLGDKKELEVVCYFTDPAAMNQVISTGGMPSDTSDSGNDDNTNNRNTNNRNTNNRNSNNSNNSNNNTRGIR